MTPPFRKILVANRGEIARRVFRTCRRLGIRTVAVYSEADRRAPHVLEADEAVLLGPAPASASYLNAGRILEAARETNAEAIHPGYGFLSEQSHFAHACSEAGVVFIGPPAEAMDVMGDKVRSRQAMRTAGVPVVPGRDDLATAEDALEAAKTLGFPVMLKASAGGGGKGMRVVQREQDVVAAFEAAAREAEAAFGDRRIFAERAILRARHVEIQLMADAHGHVVHLGERDCSVQRRHQKLIEEAPSPSPQMSPEVRAAMGDIAVRAARAVDYRGAGTIEFLFEETPTGPQFFFLEMNTRLQVEHAVTEAITGRDLVADQIHVAAGLPLRVTQDDLRFHGHAIECRIYAEDPHTFLPQAGRVALVRWPQDPHVRIDTAVVDGSVVSTHYDPMIAKLTTWGPDRATALARLRQALHETVLLGITSNLPLLRQISEEADFSQGEQVTTRYIEEHPALVEVAAPVDEDALEMAMAAAAAVQAVRGERQAPQAQQQTAWRQSARWRS